MSSGDYYDILNQHSQVAAAARHLTEDTDDRDQRTAGVLEDQARNEMVDLAQRAEAVENAIGDVIDEARSVRSAINRGELTTDQAKQMLADLRDRHRGVMGQIPNLRTSYERAQQTVEDPAALRDRLAEKYGLR